MADDAPPINIDYDAALQACLAVQADTIARHRLANGEQVWVRRAGARHAAWRYRLLGGMARLLSLPVLTPIPNLGGDVGIRTETARLADLAAAGVAVPALRAHSADALMSSHAGGHTLQYAWRRAIDNQDADALLLGWQLGLDAIADVHARGQYLSQAFARNLMYNTSAPQIVFIDFEDDPGQVLPLYLCQARDWLCYAQSGAHLMEDGGVLAAAAHAWRHTLAGEGAAVRKPVAHALRRLRPLSRLHARFWGKDTLRLAALARLDRLASQQYPT